MLSRSSPSSHSQRQDWINALERAGIIHAKQEVDDIIKDVHQFRRTADWIVQAVKRRCQREPLAYILGWQPFYHRRFAVDATTLIPRPETEYLMQYVLEQLKKTPTARIVDCGTGCGAIAITLKAEIPTLTVIAIDDDARTLEVAKRNAQRLETIIDFRLGNLLKPLGSAPIDGIIANLPYLPTAWKGHLQPEINFEPEKALYGGPDGLDLVKQIIRQVKSRGTPYPWIILELLPQQIASVSELLNKKLGGTMNLIVDLSGVGRFIYWQQAISL